MSSGDGSGGRKPAQRTRSGKVFKRTSEKPPKSTGTGGAGGVDAALGNRSFVAKQFLANEDDDLEADHLDLLDSSASADDRTADRGDMASIYSGTRSTGAGTGNLFASRDQFKVDQSVNLMDTSAATYDNKKKKHARPHARPRMTKGQASMVDVFLDYATEGPGHRQGGNNYKSRASRKEKCKELVFSTRFLIFATLVIVGCLIIVFTVTGKDDNGSSSKGVSKPESKEDRLALLEGKILEQGITSDADLKTADSPANKALMWLAEKDDASMSPSDPDLVERYVLACLYYATQPSDQKDPIYDNWLKEDKWMSKAPVCEWYGVDCEQVSGKDIVVHVNLAENQLQGTLPTELKGLSELVVLNLSGNKLQGTIPEELGHLIVLGFLLLQNNELRGTVPKSIGDMKMAEEIVLSNNKLLGRLPDNIGLLTQLRALKVDHNRLTGALPVEWKQTHIDALYLQNNEFKGHIPHSLFQLTTLTDFRIGNNFLTGTLPPEMESIFRLEIFEAQMNRLHGEVPEVFDRLHHLKEMNLHHNSFDGSLPRTLGVSTSMRSLLLDNNYITGSIPAAWAGARNMEALVLHHNQLTGPVPTFLGYMSPLRELWLNDNKFEGTIPTQLGSCSALVDIHLENNIGITGEVPAQLGNLAFLATLRVFNTSIAGTIPESVCSLREDKQLEVLAATCSGDLSCQCCSKCY